MAAHQPGSTSNLTDDLKTLGADIVAAAYLEGDFVLSSGKHSKYYFDKYLFETRPSILRRLRRHLAELVPSETDRIAAPELGAVMLGAAVSLELDLPMVIVKREAKEYATSKLIEGELRPGEKVTVIEDILTTGAQAIRAAEQVAQAGATVLRIVGVLDREEGADQKMQEAGLTYRALFRKSDLTLS